MRNHVTVVPVDKIIIVDGFALNFDFDAPINLHALQWHDGAGEMEWTDDINHPLTPSDYTEDVAPFVTLWEAEKARLNAEANRPPTLEEAKAVKLVEIMAGSNAMESAVKSRYSKLEIDSWGVQQTQAETVLSGGTLPEGALLVALANANGVSVSDFATRVLANVAQAETVTKAVVSQQQAYELMLKSCITVEEVQAITVNYTLPEAAA